MSFQQFDTPRKRFENKTNRPIQESPFQSFNEEYRCVLAVLLYFFCRFHIANGCFVYSDGAPRDTHQYIRAKRKVEEITERYRGLVSRQFNLAELLRNTDQGDKIKRDM